MNSFAADSAGTSWLPLPDGLRRWMARCALVVLAVSAPLGSATLGLAVLLLTMPFLYHEARTVSPSNSSGVFGLLQRPTGALISAGLCSTLFAAHKLDALAHVLGMALMAATCLLGARIAVRERRFFLNVAVPLALAAVVVSAGVSLYQYFVVGVSRATALLSYTNRLATLLVFFGILGAGYLLHRGGKIGWLLLPFGLLVMGGIGTTMSRAGWVAAAFGIALLGLRGGQRFVVAFLVLALLFVGTLLLEDRWAARFGTIFSLEANQDRILLWKTALEILQDHPILGSGPGSFRHVSQAYIEPSEYRGHATPHNIVLSIASDMGIAGLLAFTWLMVRAGKASWYLWRLGQPFYAGLVAAVASIFVNDLFGQGFYTTQIGTVMWFGLGLVAAFYEMERDRRVASAADVL